MALRIAVAFAVGLALAACDTERNKPAADANAAAAAANAAEGAQNAGAERAQMPACPFRRTSGWGGSVEGGRVLVNGLVDLQMAGFRPALTERPGASAGTLALDLALAPEPSAPVTDRARYDGRAASRYRRGEIWCGGERIAAFDIAVID